MFIKLHGHLPVEGALVESFAGLVLDHPHDRGEVGVRDLRVLLQRQPEVHEHVPDGIKLSS